MDPVEFDVILLKSSWPADGEFKDRPLAAMETARTRSAWSVTEDQQLRVACGIALMNCDDEDRCWIEHQLLTLRGLSALFSGIPVDVVRMAEEAEQHKRDYTLMGLWKSKAPQ